MSLSRKIQVTAGALACAAVSMALMNLAGGHVKAGTPASPAPAAMLAVHSPAKTCSLRSVWIGAGLLWAYAPPDTDKSYGYPACALIMIEGTGPGGELQIVTAGRGQMIDSSGDPYEAKLSAFEYACETGRPLMVDGNRYRCDSPATVRNLRSEVASLRARLAGTRRRSDWRPS